MAEQKLFDEGVHCSPDGHSLTSIDPQLLAWTKVSHGGMPTYIKKAFLSMCQIKVVSMEMLRLSLSRSQRMPPFSVPPLLGWRLLCFTTHRLRLCSRIFKHLDTVILTLSSMGLRTTTHSMMILSKYLVLWVGKHKSVEPSQKQLIALETLRQRPASKLLEWLKVSWRCV
jgi:hypothetical protein